MPKRIQRKRTWGWRKPEGAVIVDRTSRWGNPYRVEEMNWNTAPKPMSAGYVVVEDSICSTLYPTKQEATVKAVELYRARLLQRIAIEPDFLAPLRGKDLACWCAEGEPCHASVLLELANKGVGSEQEANGGGCTT